MKQQTTFLKKVIIGFVVNVFMIMAGLLTVLDAVIQILLDILEEIINMARSFVVIGSVILLVFYIFTRDPHFNSTARAFGIIAVVIMGGGAVFILSSFAPFITEIASILLAILRPQKLIDVLSLWAMNLVNVYESLISDNQDTWGIYIGLPTIIMDIGSGILRLMASIVALLGFPTLTGMWGYSLNFGEGMSPERFGLEWWTAIALVVLCVIYGFRLGCLVSSSLHRYVKHEESEDI